MHQGSQNRTDGVGEVEETGVSAHEPGGALDDRVGKGKGKPHGRRRESATSRSTGCRLIHTSTAALFIPEEARKPAAPALPAITSLSVPALATPSNAETPNSACAAMNNGMRVAHPAVQEPAGRGTQPDSDENHREKQRVHRAEAADGVGDVPEPDDLHSHGGKPGQQQCEPAQTDDGGGGFQLRPFDPLPPQRRTPLATPAVSGAPFPGSWFDAR